MRHFDGPPSVQGDVSADALSGQGSRFVSGDSFRNGCAAVPNLPITGERIVPGTVAEQLFREHEVRYVFAGTFVKSKHVLDVACGFGIGTHYLLRAGAQSCVGLDIDAGATEYAQATYKGCIFAQCEATSLCLADATVDAVVSFETIEHIRDQKAFLLECKRVLRPGGILVCSTPNRTLSRWGEDNPFHFQELTVTEFSKLLGTIFAEVQLYAQKNRLYPLYVGRKVLVRVLDKLQLTEPVRRLLRGKPVSVIPRTEFSGNSNDLDGEIQPYQAPLWWQPMFVIAVARKPLS
jgi:ubiquinone/menaquinone biosynthesis C-methylase UbiE